MTNKDYILRLIEEGARALSRILGLKAEGNEISAKGTAASALKGILGLDADLLTRLSTDSAIRLLSSQEDGLDPDKFLLTADLLAEMGDEGADRLSSALYAEVSLQIGHEAVMPHAERVIRVSKEEMNFLPLRTLMGLIPVYEGIGRYGLCEDAAYAMARQGEDDDGSYLFLEGLYGRLRAKGDDELAKGGLPRDEVEEGWDGISKAYHKSS